MTNNETEGKLFPVSLFTGLNVVVTGAGRGIGAAIASQFLEHGANLFAHMGVSPDTANSHTFDHNPGSGRCHIAYGDLATETGINNLASSITSRFPHIDVLINNAGTMFGRVLTKDMSLEHYHRVSDLNARAVVLLTTALLPQLKAANAASIINVTSISATTGGSAGSSIYSASKAFVATYTRSLARELAPDNIRVNAISPGTIDTDFHKRYSSKEKLAATAKAIPLGRLGTPDDCAPACLFLGSSQLSGYITGQILEINGGQLMG
jgi:3-oxoacyl-[acyl-carrier protein] reductase